MLDFLKRKKNINKNDSSIGVQKYYQLKQILENEGVVVLSVDEFIKVNTQS